MNIRVIWRLIAVIIGLGLLSIAIGLSARAETLRASWYGGGEYLARKTASGERFDPHGFTAAHRSLPFGTRLRVSYRRRQAVVTVTDRGPARWTGRSLDLSRGAAQALGLIHAGVARVEVERLN